MIKSLFRVNILDRLLLIIAIVSSKCTDVVEKSTYICPVTKSKYLSARRRRRKFKHITTVNTHNFRQPHMYKQRTGRGISDCIGEGCCDKNGVDQYRTDGITVVSERDQNLTAHVPSFTLSPSAFFDRT